MRLIITILFLFTQLSTIFSQESLLLGEQKLDEIKPQKVSPEIQKISIYQFKHRKRRTYKDSTLQGIQQYDENGLLTERLSFYGKKNESFVKYGYDYDKTGNVTVYKRRVQNNEGITLQTASFAYDSNNRVKKQIISLATIEYDYHEDDRLEKKTYYFSGGGSDTEPWIHYFFYNKNKQLIHVDTDSTSDEQTSFYNEDGELIMHEFYPGYGYSTYAYDDDGNCTRQVDYEKVKEDWDSTVYLFEYDEKNRLTHTSSSNKRGKIWRDQKWVYFEDGRINYIIEYKRNRPKWLYRYYYERD